MTSMIWQFPLSTNQVIKFTFKLNSKVLLEMCISRLSTSNIWLCNGCNHEEIDQFQ